MKFIQENITTAIYIVAGILIVVWAASSGIDQSLDNKESMLCNSAITSGNTEYFNNNCK